MLKTHWEPTQVNVARLLDIPSVKAALVVLGHAAEDQIMEPSQLKDVITSTKISRV
jgi:hypothetical protein